MESPFCCMQGKGIAACGVFEIMILNRFMNRESLQDCYTNYQVSVIIMSSDDFSDNYVTMCNVNL